MFYYLNGTVAIIDLGLVVLECGGVGFTVNTTTTTMAKLRLGDTALLQNYSGVSNREKFRIRLYNGDPSTLHLEKKVKYGGLGRKYSCPMTAEGSVVVVTLGVATVGRGAYPPPPPPLLDCCAVTPAIMTF